MEGTESERCGEKHWPTKKELEAFKRKRRGYGVDCHLGYDGSIWCTRPKGHEKDAYGMPGLSVPHGYSTTGFEWKVSKPRGQKKNHCIYPHKDP